MRASISIMVAFVLAGCAQPGQAPVRADRVESTLTLRPDGALEVVETTTLRVPAGPGEEQDALERRIATRRVDALSDVTLSVADVALPDGLGVIRPGRDEWRVWWRLPATSAAQRQLTLRYVATGTLFIENGRAHFEWPVLPSPRSYDVADVRLTWRIPQGAMSIGGPAMEAEGWAWMQESDGAWVAQKANVTAGETAALTDVLDAATLAAVVPRWQVRADRAQQMAPAFVVAALVVLVSGVGMIGMMRLRYQRGAVHASSADSAGADSLPASLGTALASGRLRIGWRQVAATFVELLARDVLRLQQEDASMHSLNVVLRPHDSGARHLARHEQVIVDALSAETRNEPMPMQEVQRRLTKQQRRFQEAARIELSNAGVLDPERRWAGRGLVMAGICSVLLGGIGLVMFTVWWPMFGGALLLVPGAVCVVGLGFLLAGWRFPTLSAAGSHAASHWVARKQAFLAASRSGMPAAPGHDAWSTAVGFGRARRHAASGANAAWLTHLPRPADALARLMDSLER